LTKLERKEINQGYILYNPEIRVRSISNEGFFMTIKSNTEENLIRKEIEIPISKDAYNKLMSEKDVYKVRKNRYLAYEGIYKYEIDVFEDNLKGLACLEVEFKSREEANEFLMPSWVVKEITDDFRYKNSYLAKNNIPVE
jgi:CYTH domain-containing protein